MVVLWRGSTCVWNCTLGQAYYILVKWRVQSICAYNCSVFIRAAYDCAGTFENDLPIYSVICSSLRVPKGVGFGGSYRGT